MTEQLLSRMFPELNEGMTDLMRAISNSDYQAFRARLRDVNTASVKGFTPLMLAIDRKLDPRFLDDLLAAGANVNAATIDGKTALILAAMVSRDFSSDAIVQKLIDAKADVNAIANDDNNALIYTVVNANGLSQNSTVQLLLNSRADINYNTYHGGALHYAVNTPRALKSTVTLLLDNKANVNLASVHSRATPLLLAAAVAPLDIIWLLINHYADIYRKDNYGNNLLIEFSSRSDGAELIDYIIRMGMSVSEANSYDETALSQAIMSGNPAIVKLLLQYGANPDRVNNHGIPVIFYVFNITGVGTPENVLDIYKTLVAQGANPNRLAEDQQLLYHIITLYGHSKTVTTEAIQTLIDDGLLYGNVLNATVVNQHAMDIIPLLLEEAGAQTQDLIETTITYIVNNPGLNADIVAYALPLFLSYYNGETSAHQNFKTIVSKIGQGWPVEIKYHLLNILTSWLTDEIKVCDENISKCLLEREKREYNLLPGASIMENLMEEIVSNQPSFPYEEFERALITNIRQKLPQIYEAYILR